MCGIAGFHLARPAAMAGELAHMAAAIRHRGPDDEGYLAADAASGEHWPLGGPDSQIKLPGWETFRREADLFLAHRRLSIIDTSSYGHQPMSGHDRRHWIVFNGEIYNFPEIRTELEAQGCRFRSGTDTEVVLAAYAAWGLECLRRFNGMWAFVLWDRPKRKLILCRDRFGVKPLYYLHDAEAFAFASEIKALAALRPGRLRPDQGQVFDYLMLGWEGDGGRTFFEGVRELEPGAILEYDLAGGSLRSSRYYRLPVEDGCPAYNPTLAEGMVKGVSHHLRRAVELRLRSDVPVGSCLSGGLDSSAVVCTVDRLLAKGRIDQVGERQSLFTAGYRDYSRDERSWAELVAGSTASSWHVVYPEARELLSDVEDLVYCQDMPFVSTSIYAQYRVMKLARERGATVLLDGQGGDELFAGYASYYTTLYREMMARGRWGELGREWSSLGRASVSRTGLLSSLVKTAFQDLVPGEFLPAVYRRLRPESAYLTGDFWQQHRRRLEAIKERTFGGLNAMLRDQMTGRSLKNLLRYEDRNSMRFSIESRTPFADDLPLIEFVFNIPGVYKIHRGWGKQLLRQATGGLVPDPIRWRRDKVGFATPEGRWLENIGQELLGFLDGRVSPAIDVVRLRRDWQAIMKLQSREGVTTIWRFLNLGIWAKVYGLSL